MHIETTNIQTNHIEGWGKSQRETEAENVLNTNIF